ncbi:hypothetical protein EDD16DRAFT_1767529 [Pisolithus croceorrhizus]|nr:hypothetical protein EDD16DRAFT_1767529 [Pisolithus croceorrhizus]
MIDDPYQASALPSYRWQVADIGVGFCSYRLQRRLTDRILVTVSLIYRYYGRTPGPLEPPSGYWGLLVAFRERWLTTKPQINVSFPAAEPPPYKFKCGNAIPVTYPFPLTFTHYIAMIARSLPLFATTLAVLIDRASRFYFEGCLGALQLWVWNGSSFMFPLVPSYGNSIHAAARVTASPASEDAIQSTNPICIDGIGVPNRGDEDMPGHWSAKAHIPGIVQCLPSFDPARQDTVGIRSRLMTFGIRRCSDLLRWNPRSNVECFTSVLFGPVATLTILIPLLVVRFHYSCCLGHKSTINSV